MNVIRDLRIRDQLDPGIREAKPGQRDCCGDIDILRIVPRRGTGRSSIEHRLRRQRVEIDRLLSRAAAPGGWRFATAIGDPIKTSQPGGGQRIDTANRPGGDGKLRLPGHSGHAQRVFETLIRQRPRRNREKIDTGLKNGWTEETKRRMIGTFGDGFGPTSDQRLDIINDRDIETREPLKRPVMRTGLAKHRHCKSGTALDITCQPLKAGLRHRPVTDQRNMRHERSAASFLLGCAKAVRVGHAYGIEARIDIMDFTGDRG